VREEHRLAAHREVAPLGEAFIVLGHEDPAQVGVAIEDDAEHVVELPLLVVGGRPVGGDRLDVRRLGVHAQLHRHAVHGAHVEQLVLHSEARLLGVVIHSVYRREEAEPALAQPPERRTHGGGVDDQRRAVAEVDRVEDALRVLVAELLGEQLQPGCVRHRTRSLDGTR
jgi:hypothetical protein